MLKFLEPSVTEIAIIASGTVKFGSETTISFTSRNVTSKTLSEILVANNIATRNDNFYAWRCLNALGIDTKDGVVRISLTHYNKKEEVNKLIDVFEKNSRYL